VTDWVIPKKIAHGSQATTYNSSIPLPDGILTEIAIKVRYTMTDASVVAGETWEGTINKAGLYDSRGLRMEARRDELSILSALLHPDVDTGWVDDTIPVTTVEEISTFRIPGLWKTIGRGAYFNFDMLAATDEWPSCSAFVSEIEMAVSGLLVTTPAERNALARRQGPDLLVERKNGASNTAHDMAVRGNALMRHFYFRTGGATTRINEATFGNATNPRQKYLGTANQNDAASRAWAKSKKATPDIKNYLYQEVNVGPGVTKDVSFVLSGADTSLMYAISLSSE